MSIRLIWAQDSNGIIGAANTLPWHLPEDARHFRALTHGCPVLMGRRTWESLPQRFRPLPGRANWVLTHQPDWSANPISNGALTARTVEEVLDQTQGQDLWVIGGGEVYRQMLPFADECVVTLIDLTVPDGDAWAPDLTGWVEASDHEWSSDWQMSTTGTRFRYCVFQPGS